MYTRHHEAIPTDQATAHGRSAHERRHACTLHGSVEHPAGGRRLVFVAATPQPRLATNARQTAQVRRDCAGPTDRLEMGGGMRGTARGGHTDSHDKPVSGVPTLRSLHEQSAAHTLRAGLVCRGRVAGHASCGRW